MKNWEEIKKELRRLAIAIKGSTNEEFPANLANLEDYVWIQTKREVGLKMDKEHCCQIDCDKDAEWEIYADGVPDTVACTEHVGELLTDAVEHRIFRLSQ